MKKITVLGVLTLILSGVIFIACTKPNEESNNTIASNHSELRSKFLEGKNQDEIIASFTILSPSEKTSLWAEKTDQLLSLNLPTKHKVLISKLKSLMLQNTDPTKLDEFRNSLISLAKITPSEDFCLMIEKLDDYKYNGKFSGTTKVSEEILNDIKNLGNNGASKIDKTTGKLVAPCNCRYTCWMYSGSSSNCKETVDGCGPFGMSTCNGHV